MKTKEFIKRVEDLGFEVKFFNNRIHILANHFTISVVYTNRVRAINTYKPILIDFKNEDKLFDLMIEYAKTPIEDREEDMKDKLLNEINRILNYVKDFSNKGLMEVLNSIEKLEDDLEIFANDLKDF